MATKVSQHYGRDFNMSTTTRDGVISLVTVWVTGNDASKTERVGQTAAEIHGFKG